MVLFYRTGKEQKACRAKPQRTQRKPRKTRSRGYTSRMTENEVATVIVDAAYHIHLAMGPGLLESVDEAVLTHELTKRGLQVASRGTGCL
jgi:hypothetical protein